MRAKILIIDDVATNLAVLADIVSEAGHKVMRASSAEMAEELIQKEVPDVILSDISMPNVDGFEFCERIRKNSETASIPLIFISALDDIVSKEKGFLSGASDFITRPFDATELRLRIERQLVNLKAIKELEDYNKRLHKMVYDHIAKITDDERYLIYGIVKLAESREDPLGIHMANVSINSYLLAQALQFSRDFEKQISNNFVEDIALAAPLHDIGNLAISDRILLKKGELTADEIKVVRTHPELGARTLTDVYSRNEYSRYLGMAIDIAYYHHERWDGEGYPKRLKGRVIPISARIFAVVDMYDSLTRDKCYRDAYSHEEAIALMKEEAGGKLDPGIFEIFLKIQDKIVRNS